MGKCTLLGLAHHEPPYVLSFHHLQLNDKVPTEYGGIMAQSFQLVHAGDYVELDVPCEVGTKVLVCWLIVLSIFSLGLVSYSQSVSCLLDRQFVLSSTNFYTLYVVIFKYR